MVSQIFDENRYGEHHPELRGLSVKSNLTKTRLALVLSVCVLVPVAAVTAGAALGPQTARSVASASSVASPESPMQPGSDKPIEPAGVPTLTTSAVKPDLASMSGGNPPTERELIAYLRADIGEFPSVVVVYAKPSSLSAIEPYTDGVPSGYTADSRVWLVTARGTFHPEFSHDDSAYSWGTLIIDATDGGILGSFAAPGDPPSVVLP